MPGWEMLTVLGWQNIFWTHLIMNGLLTARTNAMKSQAGMHEEVMSQRWCLDLNCKYLLSCLIVNWMLVKKTLIKVLGMLH